MALRMYASDWGGAYPPQEDNLAPIAERLRTDAPFRCPSARFTGPTAQEKKRIARAKHKHFITDLPGGRSTYNVPSALVIADGRLYGSSYYYHAGLTNESPGNALLLAEREAAHDHRAHVVYASGRVKLLPEAEWRKLIPAWARRSEKDYAPEGIAHPVGPPLRGRAGMWRGGRR